MNSGCAAMFGPFGDGDADGAVDDAGDAWPGEGDALGDGEGDALGDGAALGTGDAASIAVRAMIAKSGTGPSIRAGSTRQT
jgi:hypothetical protein